MSKKFAVIYPSFTLFDTHGLNKFPWPFIATMHYVAYERICGYSLGHKPDFFDTLESAQRFLNSNSLAWQYAIIECSLDNQQNISSINTIYSASENSLSAVNTHPRFYGSQTRWNWHDRPVEKSELSPKAITQLNKQLNPDNSCGFRVSM
jgi:hypothetical protein